MSNIIFIAFSYVWRFFNIVKTNQVALTNIRIWLDNDSVMLLNGHITVKQTSKNQT